MYIWEIEQYVQDPTPNPDSKKWLNYLFKMGIIIMIIVGLFGLGYTKR